MRRFPLRQATVFLWSIAPAILAAGPVAHAQQVVQVPLDPLMTARAVTTLTGGGLVPWTMGIDGGGTFSGYMTAAASKFNDDPPNLTALPDDGRFAGNARHPEVVLNFSNEAPATSQQTYWVRGAGTFMFPVPPATYSKMFLFFTSSEGTSTLTITLGYGEANQVTGVVVPDYYNSPPANDPVLFDLVTDLPKWSKTHNVIEADHHNITGVELQPMPGAVLRTVQIAKANGGYLVFWGATGVATGGPDVVSDAATADGVERDAGAVDAVGSTDASRTGSGGAAGGSSGGGGATGSGGATGGVTGGAGGGGGASVDAGRAPQGSGSASGGCAVVQGPRPAAPLANSVLLLSGLAIAGVAFAVRRRRQ